MIGSASPAPWPPLDACALLPGWPRLFIPLLRAGFFFLLPKLWIVDGKEKTSTGSSGSNTTEMTCTACGKQWGGMGGGLPQGVQKCDGCGVRAVVVAKGYAIPAARVSARDRKKEKKGGRR